uniref:Armadillo repeat-containing protein 6 n=2 Tax=Guillardia theta TaxID=55529 RepID=A0A6U6BGZ6_GUITH|mmetsp:Transcript_38458/g.121144  ORF Transcript_38458/g.121144 Transcript_38458/m.121144 type:complete len:512 (+) Transcript_38458:443-1978(+)
MAGKKRIAQDTFNAVVKENMDDFGMSREEAVEDAIKQFEMQGVDLSNIATTLSCVDQDEVPLVVLTREYTDKVNNTEQQGAHEVLTKVLKLLRSSSDANESKTIAGNAGLLQSIFTALAADDLLEDQAMTMFDCLAFLIQGHPTNQEKLKEPRDIVHGWKCEGMDAVMGAMRRMPGRADVQLKGLKLCTLGAQKCEPIKAAIVDRGGLEMLKGALQDLSESAALMAEVGSCIHALATADDLTSIASKAFDTARDVYKQEMLPLIYQAFRKHREDVEVVQELVYALKAVSIQEDIVKSVLEEGGVELIKDGMRQHMQHANLVSRCLLFFANLAENDKAKTELCQGDALPLMIEALHLHARNAFAVRCGFAAFASMALRMPENTERIIEHGGDKLLLEGMRTHPKFPEVNRYAMIAIRNIVVRRPEFVPLFLEEGAEELIRRARDTHLKCADAAFDCLRDLGCEYGGLGDKAGKGAYSPYMHCESSLDKRNQVGRGSAMVSCISPIVRLTLDP